MMTLTEQEQEDLELAVRTALFELASAEYESGQRARLEALLVRLSRKGDK